MIDGVAEYLDVDFDIEHYKKIFDQVASGKIEPNEFGKTPWLSFSLEDSKTGLETEYAKHFEPILETMRTVHPDMQGRSTGFNYAGNTDQELFIHTDIDLDTEHPKAFNLIIPVFGVSVISYYRTLEDEVWLPEKNAHGYAYYHEFNKRNDDDYEAFKKERKIGEIVATRPLLLDTNIMHGGVIIEQPRCAWATRWNNIPKHHDFYSWKDRVERILG
jgi:hypothetical protein